MPPTFQTVPALTAGEGRDVWYTAPMANIEQRRSKEKKKPAQKTLKEKRAEKRAKKMGAM